MRFAVAALVIRAVTSTPPLVALAATAFTFWMSELPFDFKRSRAFGGKPHVTLKVVTSYPICSRIGRASPTCCVKVLNSVISLPVASEKSGSERSGIDGKETDGIDGMARIM